MAIAIVFWMQYQWQYQYQLFVEYNTNCNTNTNCFWNAISMAIPIPIVCVIQYQWQYQYQFFFLCNFNINCNSNTFNCLRTNSNVQAINSYWNLPISIAIPIVPDLHKQLSMAMAIPSKTAIPMAPQYYCSCLQGDVWNVSVTFQAHLSWQSVCYLHVDDWRISLVLNESHPVWSTYIVETCGLLNILKNAGCGKSLHALLWLLQKLSMSVFFL